MTKKPRAGGKPPSDATAMPPSPWCPIVGIGASAGGLSAFRELFEHLPADTGLAFVLLQHQSADHPNLLVNLLAKMTLMPVQEATQGLKVAANHVYVMPAGKPLVLIEHHFESPPPGTDDKPFLPIDAFLLSLADAEGSRAIGVILSGSASDGALGLKAIKVAGGITFAQDIASAEHPGMPQAAISIGCVDFVQPPASIAEEISRIAHHPLIQSQYLNEQILPTSGYDLDHIFLLLKQHTGNDFSHYKPSTILRRLRRRMVMQRQDNLDSYARYLQSHKDELDALFQDLLINVTQFFRDQPLYEVLRDEVLPELVAQHSDETPLRIWIPGCSSGEEVYSVAMVLMDYLVAQNHNYTVQIFGTDIDPIAISEARRGVYAEHQLKAIPESYRKRYFQRETGSFRIVKMIRDCCVFSIQNLLKDPPFSRLDMICCRNLLIYLDQVAQRKSLRMFHYALRDFGYLVLGSSETIGSETELFNLQNKNNKIYRRKSAESHLSELPLQLGVGKNLSATSTSERLTQDRDLFREADQALLQHYCPPGVLIDEQLEIVQFRGKTGPFLEPIPGIASLNLLKMVRQEFVVKLRTELRRAISEQLPRHLKALRFQHQSRAQAVDIQILPVRSNASKGLHLLVMFEAFTEPTAAEVTVAPQSVSAEKSDQHIQLLERELTNTREYMQSIIEDQESGNEELQSANEEVQSANEELQSINEELETAKEELQSNNEELATVNDELAQRNQDLAQANNDLVNFTNNISIPVVMLDNQLNIRQFTPAAKKLLNLINTDLGRSIRDLRPNISYEHLDTLVLQVLDSMTTQEVQVRDLSGHEYAMRVRPYKTLDNRIEGVVIAFIEIDTLKALERTRVMLDSQQQQKLLPLHDDDMIMVLDLDGRLQSCNRVAVETYGSDPSTVLSSFMQLLPESQRESTCRQLAQLADEGKLITVSQNLPGADGQQIATQRTLSLLLDLNARPNGFLVLDRVLTDSHLAEIE